LINSFEKFFYSNPSSHLFSSNDDFALWQKGLHERDYHKPGKYGITPSILDPLENFIESWSSYEHLQFNKNSPTDTMGTDCSVVHPYDSNLDPLENFIESWSSYEHLPFNKKFPTDTKGTNHPYD